MLVVLTCFEPCQPFGNFAQRVPVALLPILGKPLLERLLEQCVDAGLKKIHLALIDHPRAVNTFIGSGERWGVQVNHTVLREPVDPQSLLARIGVKTDDPVMIMPAESVLDPDLSRLQEFVGSESGGSVMILARKFTEEDLTEKSLNVHNPTDMLQETGIFVTHIGCDPKNLISYVHQSDWIRVSNPYDLWLANQGALHGRFGRDSQKPVLERTIGHHSKIDRTTQVKNPVFVGNYVSIGSEGEIGPGSVIGNGVIINNNVTVVSSLILDNTYLGSQTNVVEKIVGGKFMINIRTGIGIEISDPLLLGGVQERHVRPRLKVYIEKLIASILIFLTTPIWLLKGLIRKMKGKGFFDQESFIIDERAYGSATRDPEIVLLSTFRNTQPFIAKLPGLFDVIAGKLALVGVRPLEPDEYARIKSDWAMLRFESPHGLYTILDTLDNDLDPDEKLVIENYYASTRNFNDDLKLLTRTLKSLIFREKRCEQKTEC